MGSPDLFKALTQTLKGADAPALTPAETQLTPYLSVVVAILYMMAVDGDISDRESSQLQAVIGSDTAALRRAVSYASSHDIDQFLQEAPPLLNARHRLCLLTNVCDSLMSDGLMADVEVALFDRLLDALGHSRTSFQPFFDAIAIKDRISVFGNFDDVPPAGQLTPPLMLITSMLYMMSADGSLAEEEIGRLSAIVGSSQALLKVGLRYVSKVRAPQFLPLAAAALDETQRMSVLLNACDAMLSDRQIAAAEERLMRRMLEAFGVDQKSFDSHLNILRLKNDIPEDGPRPRSTTTAEASAHTRASGTARAEGVVFERKRTWSEETGEAGNAARSEQQKVNEAKPADGGEAGIGSRISRTMQDNINNLANQFDQGMSLGTMASNARDGETRSDVDAASEGPESARAYQDAAGAGSSGQHSDTGMSVPGRHLKDSGATQAGQHLKDAQGSQAGKHWKDAEGPQETQHLKDAEGSQAGKHWKDAEGPQKAQHFKDAEGSKAGKHWKDAEGPQEAQHLKDAEGSQAGKHWQDSKGSQGGEHWKDTDGSQAAEHWKDGGATQAGQHWKDAEGAQPGQHWKDAAGPGKRREASDTTGLRAGRPIVDDRKVLDNAALDDDEGIGLGEELLERMDAVGERTRTIRDYLDPLLSAKSIAAGSRLPAIPALPPRQSAVTSAAILRIEPQTNPSDNEAERSQPMLLASDEGGPIMTQSTPAANTEESRVNQQLRVWSRVLLPALFLTYGATMVGETMSGHNFITSENLATDARTVHQMASVQQTVYRVTPEAVLLSTAANGLNTSVTNTGLAQATPAATTAAATATVAATNEAELSDREKADSALEQRKRALEAEVRRHQSASAIAAERQQWFAYAKSIVLLGLGMALWGVLFRSLRTLHGSSVAGIAGLLMSMNAHWLLLRF